MGSGEGEWGAKAWIGIPAERKALEPSRLLHNLVAMSTAELRALPPGEKLRIIEELWGDFAAGVESYPSPAWHAEELRKTEADLAAGRVEVIDWNAAKRELREQFP